MGQNTPDGFFSVIVAVVALLLLSRLSCPTLCDPRDRSPPGSPAPGILQARTLEWAAISFSVVVLVTSNSKYFIKMGCAWIQPLFHKIKYIIFSVE